jgi:imidazolonepropionase-like amidohydrolase
MASLLTRAALLATTLTAISAVGAGQAASSAEAEPGVALLAAKALVCELEGEQVIDGAVLLMRGASIEAVGSRDEVEIPEGYEVVDLGDLWIAPGMVELHCHVGTPNPFFPNDINDMVYLTNPGLRASPSTIASNKELFRGLTSGVTTVLFIPGSGTNIGGQGVLFKTAPGGYEQNLVRNPGSMKLAQAGNPERWLIRPGRSFMNWNTRNTFERGLAYAKRWEAHREEGAARPERDPQWEIFRALYEKETQISTHTQIYQVVLMTITMVRQEFGLDVYIDHGTFDGHRAGALAEEAGVPAILGPRGISRPYASFLDTDGRILGVAAEYQREGHTRIGFNTDSPVVPQDQLFLQSAMGVRYGLDNSNLENVRGLTIVPAAAAGIDDRVGSLEAGKDADVLVVSGDPSDPRTEVRMVFVDGERVYDVAVNQRP